MQFFVSAVFLGRENCPWPMILNGSDGYNPAFDFTNQVGGGLAQG